jgi:hypothetical protein
MMERLAEKALITEADDILKALRISLHQGNVVGIFVRPHDSDMYLTAVEDIFSSTVSDQKIIILKKLDLHGNLLRQNQLLLASIEKLRFFNTLYKDGLKRTLRSIAAASDFSTLLRIRKRECNITLNDLRIVLMKTLDSGHRIRVTLDDQATVVQGYIRDFDNKLEVMDLTAGLNDKTVNQIQIDAITQIESESFFHFNGLSSKVFHVCM